MRLVGAASARRGSSCWRSRPNRPAGGASSASAAAAEILKPDLYAVTASGEYEDHWFCEVDRGHREPADAHPQVPASTRRYRRTGQEQAARRRVPDVVVWVVPDDTPPQQAQSGPRTQLGSSTASCSGSPRRPARRLSSREVRMSGRLATSCWSATPVDELRATGRSVDMVLTSPPYFRLRDYQRRRPARPGGHVEQWVDGLRRVAAELHRVLVPTGSLSGSTSATPTATTPAKGAGRKSLLLGTGTAGPGAARRRLDAAQQDRLAKANPMPTSVRDRLTCTWEALYVFVKQPRYFFDLDAIRVPHTSRPARPQAADRRATGSREAWRGPNGDERRGLRRAQGAGRVGHPLGKNPGDVWRDRRRQLPRRPPRHLPAGTGASGRSSPAARKPAAQPAGRRGGAQPSGAR